MREKKSAGTARKTLLPTPKKVPRKPRRKPVRHPEAVIHQGVLTGERFLSI